MIIYINKLLAKASNGILERIGVIDNADSVLWITRYNDIGQFEIYIPVTGDLLGMCKKDYVLTRDDDPAAMIIESIEITTDIEKGDYMRISGRSIESLLDRRSIFETTTINTSVTNAIVQLLNANFIMPDDERRKFNCFTIGNLVNISDRISTQFTGENLLDIIKKLCKTYDLGFNIEIDEYKNFKFNIYSGVDRSYNQTSNPYVVFSPEFDNVINSEYENDSSNSRTTVLVAGEGEGYNRKTALYEPIPMWGYELKELYVDARDLSSSSDNGNLSYEEYRNLLLQRGEEKYLKHVDIENFICEIEPRINYRYNEDYFIGDDVQVKDKYGTTYACKVVEVMETNDANGNSILPKFERV